MNILLLIDNFGSGGAQKQMVTLAKLLQQLGFKIEFLIYNEGDFFRNEVEKLGIPINEFYSRNYLLRILRIRKFIRKSCYKAIISFLDTPNFLNSFAAVGGKKWKVIVSERSGNVSNFKKSKNKILFWFNRYSDTIVCNSDHSRELWTQFYPSYRNKLVTINNPIILPEITQDYKPCVNGKFNIVVVASYQYIKNPLGLIEAVYLMSEETRNSIVINWYGRKEVTINDTCAFNEAKSLCTKYNLDSVIHLNEERKDVVQIMKKSDIVGLFSHYEGQPNVICEAMMIGKPVIMSRVSDYQKLVDVTNGFLCDWDKPQTIKQAIESAMRLTPSQLIQMGRISKSKAQKLFEPELIIDAWKNVIQD